MLGKFWDALFDYADNAKAEGDKRKYEICHEIQDILQKAYDDGLKHSNVIKTHKPKGKCEELVMSIPDIKVFKDKDDGELWYELEIENRGYETMRFDYPEEVLRYIIDNRTRRISESMTQEKNMILAYISKRIVEIRNVPDVLEQGGNKKAVIVEKKGANK